MSPEAGLAYLLILFCILRIVDRLLGGLFFCSVDVSFGTSVVTMTTAALLGRGSERRVKFSRLGGTGSSGAAPDLALR